MPSSTASISGSGGWLINLRNWIKDICGFSRTTTADGHPLTFVSLGLAVIDEIHFGSQKKVYDVLGGSGTYATLGARLFVQRADSRTVGWMIHAGEDWPSDIEASLLDWRIRLVLQKRAGEVSTRGLLRYKDSTFGPKIFEYTTPVLTVSPDDLCSSGLLRVAYLHLLATPQNLEIQARRLEELWRISKQRRAFLIWEPAPPHCNPQNLQACLRASRLVDLVSPNHLELAALFGETSTDLNKVEVESLATKFVEAGIGPAGTGTIIVRAGEHGCLICSAISKPSWLAPYYDMITEKASENSIVDTTGAGNAFLGGFAMGHSETGNVLAAARYGTVAASFAVEQIGIPSPKIGEDGHEFWNGSSPRERLRTFSLKVA